MPSRSTGALSWSVRAAVVCHALRRSIDEQAAVGHQVGGAEPSRCGASEQAGVDSLHQPRKSGPSYRWRYSTDEAQLADLLRRLGPGVGKVLRR